MRVRAVLHELGLEVELIDVSIGARVKPPELLAVNPNGKVPVLVEDDGFALWESRAINVYLASKRPERDLYPSEPRRRAIVDQWTYWSALHLVPAMQTVGFERFVKPKYGLGPTDEKLVAAKLAEVERGLAIFDRGLAGREWIAGALSLADFAIAPPFAGLSLSGISLESAPNVQAWVRRLDALPSWQRAKPPA
jgi:glutathione S-transferase